MKNREALMKFISTQGYKRNSPDVNNPVNVIPTGNITMKGVDFPVRGVDNLGNEIIMQPGENYHFPGQYVVETPMAQQGGSIYNYEKSGNTDITPQEASMLAKNAGGMGLQFTPEFASAYFSKDTPAPIAEPVIDFSKTPVVDITSDGQFTDRKIWYTQRPEWFVGKREPIEGKDYTVVPYKQWKQNKHNPEYSIYPEYNLLKNRDTKLAVNASPRYQFGSEVNNYVKGDTTTDVTSRHRLDNLKNNPFNKALIGTNSLSDPKNMTWALPNRGFFGKVKALAGAASGISGAVLGYEKLFTPDKTQSYINNYETGEHGTTENVLGDRRLKQWGQKDMYQESPVDEKERMHFTTPGSESYYTQRAVAASGGTMRDKYQPGGPVEPGFQDWFVKNAVRADVLANVANQEELLKLYRKDTSQPGNTGNFGFKQNVPGVAASMVSNPLEESKLPEVNSPQFKQYPISTVQGDSPGVTVANNALLGFGMVNQVLEEQDLEKEYNRRMRELGNTDARYNANNAVNPFGNYTLNAGPASNFALVANTPIQDFGTRSNAAKRGGTVYQAGGEYYVTKDDIKNIIAAGGEIEFID